VRAKLDTIKATLVLLGQYFSHELTDVQLKMYAEDLMDLSVDELTAAANAYRRDPENTRFPLPAQLIALVRPRPSERDDAIDVARRLQEAAARWDAYWDMPYHNARGVYFNSSHGPQPTFVDAVRADAGDLGLEIIARFGGWKRFYQAYADTDRGQFHAQLRELAESKIRRARAGQLDRVPSLSDYSPPKLKPPSPGEAPSKPAFSLIKSPHEEPA
jgi:hypothetical protein